MNRKRERGMHKTWWWGRRMVIGRLSEELKECFGELELAEEGFDIFVHGG